MNNKFTFTPDVMLAAINALTDLLETTINVGIRIKTIELLGELYNEVCKDEPND